MEFKPDGYSTASPYLVVNGARETIDFIVSVLEGVELQTFPNDSGGITHGEVRIGDSVVMVADSVDEWSATESIVYVYVKDVDAAYQRALEYGAESVQEPQVKDDPDRRACVRDGHGTTWFMATRVG